MKILLINPNSDPDMTRDIENAARVYAQGTFETVCQATPGSPRFIETYADQAAAAPGMIKIIGDNQDGFDAFIIACHSDPNLDLMKETSVKPVVGIGEASMKLATMLGHKFAVISTASHSIPNKEALVEKYHLDRQLASVRAPEKEWLDRGIENAFRKTARAAIAEDGAEVIVLGCAGLASLAGRLQERLGVPVLDGIACALIIASGLVRAGLSTSKARRYSRES